MELCVTCRDAVPHVHQPAPGLNLPALLNVNDVAVLLKLAPKTVYALARRGQVPSVTLGGSVRFRYADIARLVLGDAPAANAAADPAPAVTASSALVARAWSIPPHDWSRRMPIPAASPAPVRRRRA